MPDAGVDRFLEFEQIAFLCGCITRKLISLGCQRHTPYIANYPVVLYAQIIFALIISLFFAPIIHPNRLASDKQKARLKKNSKVIAIIESAIIIMLFFSLLDGFQVSVL